MLDWLVIQPETVTHEADDDVRRDQTRVESSARDWLMLGT